MRLQLLAKDVQSGEKNCPSVSDDLDSNEIVIEAVRKYLAAR